MTEITVNEVLKEFKINVTELAQQLGVSISLISKIRWNREKITLRTQKLFQQHYPDYKLVNTFKTYKEELNELEAGYSHDIKFLEWKIGIYEDIIDLMRKYLIINKDTLKFKKPTKKDFWILSNFLKKEKKDGNN